MTIIEYIKINFAHPTPIRVIMDNSSHRYIKTKEFIVPEHPWYKTRGLENNDIEKLSTEIKSIIYVDKNTDIEREYGINAICKISEIKTDNISLPATLFAVESMPVLSIMVVPIYEQVPVRFKSVRTFTDDDILIKCLATLSLLDQ